MPNPTHLHPSYSHLTNLQISHSSMQTFNSCERKFEFRKLLGSQLTDDTAATSLGRAMHVAIANAIETDNFDSAIWSLFNHYNYQYYHSPIDDRSIESAIATLIAVANFVNTSWPNLQLAKFHHPETGELRHAIEVKFAINLVDTALGLNPETGKPIPVTYIGYIDAIFYDPQTRTYIIVDFKTTTRDKPNPTVEYYFDTQCIPYAFVLNEVLDQPQESFDVVYLLAKLHLLEPKVQAFKFTKTMDDVREWVHVLLNDLDRLRNHAISGWFPRRASSCIAYNRPCLYFDYCQTRNHEQLKRIMAMEPASEQPDDEPPWITLDLSIVND